MNPSKPIPPIPIIDHVDGSGMGLTASPSGIVWFFGNPVTKLVLIAAPVVAMNASAT
jgi:hypothetical protein